MDPKPKILLGREHELALFAAALDALAAGRGRLLLVSGEPGIGKTSLADELAIRAAAAGLVVRWGSAWEAGGAPSYWPFVQILRSELRDLEGDALRTATFDRASELSEIVPELRARLGGAPPGPCSSERFPLFDAVSGFLLDAARRGPRLFVLEDLHATDPSTLALLTFLANGLPEAPLLVVATYREAEAALAPELGRFLARLARRATTLPLRRLDQAEVARFVVQAGVDGGRARALFERSEGNPLFLRELVALSARGAHLGVRLPRAVEEAVGDRLALLNPEARRLLEAASVFGREAAWARISAIVGTPRSALEATLGSAIDAGVIETSGESLRFNHVLLREGLYRAMDAERRAQLHRDAAAAARRADGDAAAAEIAHHLLATSRPGDVAAAADASLVAAGRAMGVLAFEDAAGLLERVIEPLESSEGEHLRLYEVLLLLGVARIHGRQRRLGLQACGRAASLARRLGDAPRLARAALAAACETTFFMRDEAVIAMLEEALAALPDEDGALRARCLAALAGERQPEPDPAGPIGLADEAVAMARRLGDDDALRAAMTGAALARVGFGDPLERRVHDEEVLRLATRAGDRLLAARARVWLALDHLDLGDIAGAEAHLEVTARSTGSAWVLLGIRSAIALFRGRFHDAVAGFDEAERLGRDGDDVDGASAIVAFPLGVYRATELVETLPSIAAALREGFRALDHPLASCVGEMVLASLYGHAEDREHAGAALARARSSPVFPAIREPAWLALLADAARLTGDVELARDLHERLLPRRHRLHGLGPLGMSFEPYAQKLGVLAMTLGRGDEAVEHFEAARAMVGAIGLGGRGPRVDYELAGALLLRGADGDAARAGALLSRARTEAEGLGQSGLVALVAARQAASVEALAVSAPPASIAVDRRGLDFALTREGEVWAVRLRHEIVRLRDSRGLQVLDRLVRNPAQEFHVLQLLAFDQPSLPPETGDRLLDDRSVTAYRARLRDLKLELEEAESFADAGRAAGARLEIERIAAELARAVGLGGRPRAGGSAERARTAVQKRLRDAIRRIGEALPVLGRHLDVAIHTGTFCAYLPEGRGRGRR